MNYRTTSVGGGGLTVRFEKVRLRVEKTGKCGCGKRRRRSRTFWMTSSPFNNFPSREQLLKKLHLEADEWKDEPITCEECE